MQAREMMVEVLCQLRQQELNAVHFVAISIWPPKNLYDWRAAVLPK